MYLYGASGHARVIIDIIEALGLTIDGLIDDNPQLKQLQGYPVAHQLPDGCPDVIISIGNPQVRKRLSLLLKAHFISAVHPSAIVSSRVMIGEGTVVMQGAVVQSCTSVGHHCIINTGASVDHECRLGDFVHISPHATLCGNAQVGQGTWVGAGSVVIPGIKIGRWSMIGAGSVVVRDIPDGVVAYGNPCRIHRLSDWCVELENRKNDMLNNVKTGG